MWNALKTSWWPALCGFLALLCEGSALVGVTPEEYKGAAQGLCMILISLGLIGAKQANKTNAPEPVAVAQKVPASTEGGAMKSIALLLCALFLVSACAPVVDVYKMGNEYVQDAHSRNWWGPNWHRVTYCWKLDNGYCPKEDVRVEVASKIGMDAPGMQMAIGAVQSMPLALGLGLGLANSGSRITQSVGGFQVNEHFSTKFFQK